MKKFLPHLIALVLFIAIPFLYFSPVLKNKELKQHDITTYTGMSKEVVDYRAANHEEALWTNSAFGGMPAFQISVQYPSNMIAYVHRILSLGLPFPIYLLFLLLLGFYILMMVLKVDPWLGVLGAIAFAFSSFFFISIDSGHNTKVLALAYMPPVFAGILLLFRGNYLWGGAMTALFLALEIFANHLQITYYLFLFVLVYLVFEFTHVVRTKQFMPFAKSCAALGLAALLAVGSNAGNLWSTYEYGKSTTRGQSELTSDKENKTTGLDKDYATGWSYGRGETMSLMIPNFKGGGNNAITNVNKDAVKNVDQRLRQTVGSMDSYWGDQPFTAGPTYAGAVIVFLFVLGLFIVEGRMKWFLLAGTILSISLAWGKNMMWLTDFFLDYVPGYNKFRSVSMILTLAEFTLPFLAILALDKIIQKPELLKEETKLPLISKPVQKQKLFYVAFAITGGLSLLYFLIPDTMSSFLKSGEYEEIFTQFKQGNPSVPDQQIKEYIVDLLPALETARQSILRADAIRSFMLITLAAGILWFYFRTKFDKRWLYATLIFIVLVDLWSVDKRYLNNDKFADKKEVKNPFPATKADLQILEDKSPDYRVLNLAVSTFNDASTSFYHKSIGGYHGAKLKRYQELIESQIYKNIQEIQHTFSASPSDSAIRATFARLQVLNMLNTRYVIYNGDAPPLENRYAMGNAWLVKEIKFVPNADAEIAALSEFNASTTAIVDERFKTELSGFTAQTDPTASVTLEEYHPNHLVYKSQAGKEQLAVFSEIYYHPGWNAYVDGQLTPHIRVNYILRAMRLPAGTHKVEFKFEPKAYVAGEKVSLISSISLLLLVIGIGGMELKKKMA